MPVERMYRIKAPQNDNPIPFNFNDEIEAIVSGIHTVATAKYKNRALKDADIDYLAKWLIYLANCTKSELALRLVIMRDLDLKISKLKEN